MLRKLVVAAFCGAFLLVGVGCPKSDEEKATDAVDDAAGAVKEAGEKAGDAAEDAGEAVGDAIKDATDG